MTGVQTCALPIFFKKRDPDDIEGEKEEAPEVKSNKKLNSDLIACILNFNKKYMDRFLLLSISNENYANTQISNLCKVNGIPFVFRNILLPKYRLNGKGHLNIDGNKLVGDLLYESFIQNNKK